MIPAGSASVTKAGNGESEWQALRAEAMDCTRCPLFRPATQTVFGEGPVDAPLMLVGEQPGDREDLAGRPFVGPAGRLLDSALAAAGIDRERIYLTNAVKHFKFELRGKRQLHARPDAGEIEACRWWLDHERVIVRPRVIVALGATAAHSLFGRSVTVRDMRGTLQRLAQGEAAYVTIHPSFLLRLRDRTQAQHEFKRFVADLRQAGTYEMGLSKMR